jgi:hypothetical protein
MVGLDGVAGDLVLAAAQCSNSVLSAVLAWALPSINPNTFAPGWLSLRTRQGATPLFVAASWGSLSTFAFLFRDLQTRAGSAWAAQLAAHERDFPALQPLLLSACDPSASAFVVTNPAAALTLETNCCKIAVVLARSLGPVEVASLWRDTRGQVWTVAMRAARWGFIPVLSTVKDKVGATAWASLLATRQDGSFASLGRDPEPAVARSADGGAQQRDWLVAGTALSCAAGALKLRTVAFLLESAEWGPEDVACALLSAVHEGAAKDRDAAVDVAEVLARHLCTLVKASAGSPTALTSQLLGRVMSALLTWVPIGEERGRSLAELVVGQLCAPLIPKGPWSTVRGAIVSGNVDAVYFVFEQESWAADATAVLNDATGLTCLMLAAQSPSQEVLGAVASFLECQCVEVSGQEAAVRATDTRGRTAADYAAHALMLENLEVLGQHFGDWVGSEPYRYLAHSCFDDGSVPLGQALRLGLDGVVEGLLLADANPLELCEDSLGPPDLSARATCLELTVHLNRLDLFSLLAGKVSSQGHRGRVRAALRRSLRVACSKGLEKLVVQVVDELRTYGVNGEEGEGEGEGEESPVMSALRGDHVDCVRALLDHGWKPSSADMAGIRSRRGPWSSLLDRGHPSSPMPLPDAPPAVLLTACTKVKDLPGQELPVVELSSTDLTALLAKYLEAMAPAWALTPSRLTIRQEAARCVPSSALRARSGSIVVVVTPRGVSADSVSRALNSECQGILVRDVVLEAVNWAMNAAVSKQGGTPASVSSLVFANWTLPAFVRQPGAGTEHGESVHFGVFRLTAAGAAEVTPARGRAIAKSGATVLLELRSCWNVVSRLLFLFISRQLSPFNIGPHFLGDKPMSASYVAGALEAEVGSSGLRRIASGATSVVGAAVPWFVLLTFSRVLHEKAFPVVKDLLEGLGVEIDFVQAVDVPFPS